MESLSNKLVRKEGEGERRAMLRMRIGLDFTTLGTLLLMPTLVQHSSCTGYLRLVYADTILVVPGVALSTLLLRGGCSNLLFV